jgi:mannose-1-phosphate guanylyltransferase
VTAQGVTDAVLNLHHLPATVTGIVGDGTHLGLRVRYSWEQPLLGSAGGPRRALPLLSCERFLIVNGDTLCGFDVEAMVEAHDRANADVTMAVVPNPDPDHYNGLLMNDSGAVTGWVPRGRAHGSWHFIGIQVVEARAFAGLPDGVVSETVAGFYRDLVRDSPGRVRAWRVETPFLDVGTCADYHGAALARDTHVGPDRTVIWPGSSVSPQATLEGCIVVGDIHVPAGFRARSAVLGPAAFVTAADTAAEIRDGISVFPMRPSARVGAPR